MATYCSSIKSKLLTIDYKTQFLLTSLDLSLFAGFLILTDAVILIFFFFPISWNTFYSWAFYTLTFCLEYFPLTLTWLVSTHPLRLRMDIISTKKLPNPLLGPPPNTASSPIVSITLCYNYFSTSLILPKGGLYPVSQSCTSRQYSTCGILGTQIFVK